MPEGPECKHIADGLAHGLESAVLQAITIHSGRYQRHGPPTGLVTLRSHLPLQIQSVGVKGKFIYWLLDGEWSVWNTLGMSGQWWLSGEPDSHCHVSFQLVTEEGPHTVYFRDVRNFGTLRFMHGMAQLEQQLGRLGPDVLADTSITREEWLSRIRKYNHWTLPKFLMDQSKVSGVGNYLKAEVLYATNLSPLQVIGDISDDNLWYVYIVSCEIARSSYLSRGASFLSYLDTDGEKGGYNFSFKVYRQEEDPYGNPVERIVTDDGRTTHWVPSIQGYPN